MRKAVVILFVLAGFAVQGQSQLKNGKFPEVDGSVNDLGKVFSSVEERALEDLISNYQEKTGREISLATVKSIRPYKSMGEYAAALANHWEVGDETKNNGLLILLNKPDRKIWIATANETQKVLPDELCKSIIEKVILPELKGGNYYKGIKKGLEEITYQWDIRTLQPN